jgi:FMN phosphatase YigB (HAD superfamily)
MIRGILIDPAGVLFFPEEEAEGGFLSRKAVVGQEGEHSWVAQPRLRPDARLTLGRLQRRGYRLGLVAEGTVRDQAYRLATTRLTEFWETTLISQEHGGAAMDCNLFGCALDCLGLTAEETVFVSAGAAPGFAAAREVGLTTFWVNEAGLQPPPYTLVQLGRFWDLTGSLDLFENVCVAS